MKQLFTVLILIVISSTIGVNDMQAQKIKAENNYDPFEKLVIETIGREYKNEVLWVAAQCDEKNVPVEYSFSILF